MNKTEQADIKLPFVARFRNIVTAMFLIRRMANVAGGGGYMMWLRDVLEQGLSTAGPPPGTGSWHQLYRVPRCSPGIFHFSFLSNFHK